MPQTVIYGEEINPKMTVNQFTAEYKKPAKPLDARFKKQLRVLLTNACGKEYSYRTLKLDHDRMGQDLHDDGTATDIAFFSNRKKRFLNKADTKDLETIQSRCVYTAGKRGLAILVCNQYPEKAKGHFEILFLPSMPKEKSKNILARVGEFLINCFPHIKGGRR